MRNEKHFSLILICTGLLYFLVQLLFPICEIAAGEKPMKCFWTAQAQMGIGATVIAGGLLYFFSRNLQRRLGMSLMMLIIATLSGAFPVFLIGVCANHAMPCRAGALPAWIIVSILLLTLSLLDIWRLSSRLTTQTSDE